MTIGNFDGVHLGHQSVFQTLHQLSVEHHAAPTLVITFEPHPQKLLNPNRVPERITRIRGKARWMESCRLDAMFILHFTKKLATYSPETFVRHILVDNLAVSAVLVGENFHFGAGGTGTFATLQQFGKQFGFSVYCKQLKQQNQKVISSTRIRELIRAGKFSEVIPLLGRDFEVEARVTHGHKRGQALGFPTANLALAGMLHPAPGVYIVEAKVDGQWLPAVANLGHNPTFGHQELRLEVHILAKPKARFELNIYRQVLRVRFLQHIRHEKKFANLDALKARIAADVETALAFFRQR